LGRLRIHSGRRKMDPSRIKSTRVGPRVIKYVLEKAPISRKQILADLIPQGILQKRSQLTEILQRYQRKGWIVAKPNQAKCPAPFIYYNARSWKKIDKERRESKIVTSGTIESASTESASPASP